MPSAALKPCVHPGCIELVRSGSLCAEHRRLREQERGSANVRGYDYAWRRIREAFLRKHMWCSDPFGVHTGMRVMAQHVDHRVPLSQGGTHDEGNLNPLCTSCHSRKTAISDGGFGNQVQSSKGGV